MIDTDPLKTVPVITVPCPLIRKQWSILNKKGPSLDLFGTNEHLAISLIASLIPIRLVGFAATLTIGAEANTVVDNADLTFFVA